MNFSANHRRRQSGLVLIMALAALAVVMILLLALFAGGSHQLRGAQSDAAMAREKMLADSAVALVIGQIAQASTQNGQAWISQPGLVRTYAATAGRTPTACYKLYSTSSLTNMTDTSGNLNFLGSDVPANWNSTPSLYTDLNSPALTPSGQSIYPVLDQAALMNATNLATGTQVQGVSSDGGAVTMPVAWLYQLQDGTLGPASSGTPTNPIVARMAFWTDDETCKINVNTAGVGSPWNTPRANSTDDVAWGSRQPAAGEYTAYPGHPAMTSLAAVFGTNAATTNSFTPQQLLGLSPRYAYGGSQLGTQSTTPGEMVPAKMDRLYASLDELCFSTNISAGGQRVANPVSASQLEQARFVLTAHSVAPETTLLGEPRVAIWPVADSTSVSVPRITAMDRAIMSDAKVGTVTTSVRNYFFQRNSPLQTNDDFDPAAPAPSPSSSNLQLFGDLVNRGNKTLPGYGATLGAKYPGEEWTQLLLEITDFIHGLNAVDPSPAPFVPFAGGDATGVGHGFVEPLTITYGTGTSQATLHGLGRCPTLSSLTLVFYVSGFGFKDGTYIDYDETPDDSGANWQANFLPGSAKWKNVVNERVRAFVVPCTFQPGCAYPEVSDACSIQISGLNLMQASSGANSSNFGFPAQAISVALGTPLKALTADRAWGDNEGPQTWRQAGDVLMKGGAVAYPFAGTQALTVPMTTATASQLDPKTGGGAWPPTSTLVFAGLNGVGVTITDAQGNVLQTLSINLPPVSSRSPFSIRAPTINGEYAQQDGSITTVAPSFYMCLKNRLKATQGSRPFLIQPGDVCRSAEAATDLRIIAGLSNVPAIFFQSHPTVTTTSQGGSIAHNLHFADGTAAFGASGITSLVSQAANNYGAATSSVIWPDWRTTSSTNSYALPISAPRSCPSGPPNFVTMTPVGQTVPANAPWGDWDTGPGMAPDGAQINLPDSGTTLAPGTAYFSLAGGQMGAATQRTPNALVPSPVIFGSLPTGINPETPAQSAPWRTLLFCPYPAADGHPGFGNATAVPPIVPDHLMLDNFWMPVVEPYGISTCMATAGKINLNDQIAPFPYLHRNTALHALLNDLRIPAISITAAGSYKSAGMAMPTIWNAVDENATIAQIENRFANGSADAYLSESEICTVPLVPAGLVPAGTSVASAQTLLDNFWKGLWTPDGGLTGDNLRELPYAQLYGRLTTRSNSYTVHVRVQVLQKLARDPNQNVWNEGVDLVQGEWRGSYEVERYLDPAAKAPVAGTALGPYKFRILSARRFAP